MSEGKTVKKTTVKKDSEFYQVPKKEWDEMKAFYESFTKSKEESKPVPQSKTYDSRYIKVYNMLNNKLNISTEKDGKGRVYTFHTFGHSNLILNDDLVDIVRNQYSAATEGKFFIADKEFVDTLGLTRFYEKIISPEELLRVIETKKSKEAVDIFKSVTPSQQQTIIDLLVLRVKDNKYDADVVDKISRESGIKIIAKAEEAKEFEKILQEKK